MKHRRAPQVRVCAVFVRHEQKPTRQAAGVSGEQVLCSFRSTCVGVEGATSPRERRHTSNCPRIGARLAAWVPPHDCDRQPRSAPAPWADAANPLVRQGRTWSGLGTSLPARIAGKGMGRCRRRSRMGRILFIASGGWNKPWLRDLVLGFRLRASRMPETAPASRRRSPHATRPPGAADGGEGVACPRASRAKANPGAGTGGGLAGWSASRVSRNRDGPTCLCRASRRPPHGDEPSPALARRAKVMATGGVDRASALRA